MDSNTVSVREHTVGDRGVIAIDDIMEEFDRLGKVGGLDKENMNKYDSVITLKN